MPIEYLGKSSAMGSGTGAITVAVPSGTTLGDLLLLILEGYNAYPTTPNDWIPIDTQVNSTAYLRVCYKIAGASESSVSVADSGDSTRGIMLRFSGVDNSTPIHTSSKSTSSGTAFTSTGLTTTVDGCMIVTCVGFWDADANDTSNYSSWVNASLASITEGHDQTTNAGSGGGIAFAYGIDTTAGTVNGTSATTDLAANVSATIIVALKPVVVVNITIASVTGEATADGIIPTITTTYDGYIIQRKTGVGGAWVDLAEIKSTSTLTYTDTSSLSSGTTYYYRIRRYTSTDGAYSLWSNEVAIPYNTGEVYINFGTDFNSTASASADVPSVSIGNDGWTGKIFGVVISKIYGVTPSKVFGI